MKQIGIFFILMLFCSTPVFPNSLWYFDNNNVEQCWKSGVAGGGVFAYITDTPIKEDSRFLKGKLVIQINKASENITEEIDKIHGLSMGSLICADFFTLDDEENKNKKISISGIAPKSKIISYSWKPGGKLYDVLSIANSDIMEKNARGKLLIPDTEDITLYVINVSSGISKSLSKQANPKQSDNYQRDFEDDKRDLKTIANELKGRNAVIVAGVGNEGCHLTEENISNNRCGLFPGAFKRNKRKDNILRVGGTLNYTKEEPPVMGKKSNYGEEYVDILSPGFTPIITNEKDGRMAFGTSNAAAITTCAILLLIECRPNAQYYEIIEHILNNADKHDFLNGKVKDGNVLNIWRSVENFCFDKNEDEPYLKENSKTEHRKDF